MAVSAGVTNEHEGPTDHTRWLKPQGTLRAVFLFVDFSDAVGTSAELTERKDRFATSVGDWMRSASYGKANLSTTFTSSWRRMPRAQSAYAGYHQTFDGHRSYLQDAVNASDAVVDFRNVDLVYVISPRTATTINVSSALIAPTGLGLMADGVERRFAVNLGTSVDDWDYKLVNHETGHLFGLPDLYTYGQPWPQLHEPVGGWDLMGLISAPAPDHLAWHKWKMGWLNDSQISCRTARGKTSATLTPLGTTGGLKTAVVKVTPHRAIVVENRQVSPQDVTSPCFRPGVLVYAVDTTVGGGNRPVTVLDRTPNNAVAGCSPEHAELGNATLVSVNQQLTDAASGVRVRLTAVSGGNRTVEVSW
ncbi:hypothetical protein BG844_05885 [Couchioplanes caeruleus subsp. caeruleus]|uniref:M6 family metalloprotease-like protein n=1 Tax=Couchioplanes caeruleus subsp. caeruleus TaxID=56427 RepID=A0A1K0FQS6_9ACTN|nr:hypothetical protein BG844_05885 [Couchioplanes caeruleus subsp. caeruleus]